MYDFLCSVKQGEEKLREAFENFIKVCLLLLYYFVCVAKSNKLNPVTP